MFEVDLHTHTRFFHGWAARPTPFDPVGAAMLARCSRWRGLDGVSLTNHDYHVEFDVAWGSCLPIPGIEITTTGGHVLVVGPEPPSRTEPGELTPEEAVALAHDRDCAAIMAHPIRRGTLADSDAAFDAVELNGKHPQNVDRIREIAAVREIPIVGGSDSHFPFEVGRALTRIDASHLSPASVVDAIRDGRVEPRVQYSYPAGALRRGYRLVHRYLR